MRTPTERSSLLAAAIPILIGLVCCFLLPRPASAIPAFARKYGVKCYTCHTMPPVLNKTGYTFKRLGYRMLPDNMDGTQAAPRIRELDKAIRWSLTNSLALITQGSYSLEKTENDSPTSSSSFNLDEAALFMAGSLPENGFSYFSQFELSEGGESGLEQAVMGYTGGRANSSYFGKAGAIHLQEGEGTRAAMFYNLFPDPSMILTNTDPLNFTLDQHPVGIDAGYTWASPYFKEVLGLSAKVTNGVNADGSEILFDSTKNAKDVWFDADFWFGPDGGVTFMTYYGRKDQIQNPGTPFEFTFRPTVRRYGVFGNYLFFDKLDVQGAYLRSRDDWEDAAGSAITNYIANGYRAEADYYIRQGFAVMGRYDRLSQTIASGPVAHSEAWAVGGEKALTDLGNVIIRASYSHERDTDPVSGSVTRDKLFRLDLRVMW